MKASLLGADSERWLLFLDGARHDFYQLPAYVTVSARQDAGEAAALYVEDGRRELLMPLVIRPIEGDAGVDATSPYGYPGVLTKNAADGDFEREALDAGIEMLRERGVVSLFVRLHPLLNPEPAEGVGTLVCHGKTVTIDLSLPDEILWSQTRRNHRQQIRQAREAGYVAHIDHDWTRFEDFKRLYRATMEQRSASSYYFFDDGYFELLRTSLRGSIHLAFVEVDDTVVAAALFVATAGIVQMHLTGHDVGFASYQPMKLLFDYIRTWSREQGQRWLHLGGGRGGADDSLYHFKAGFSPIHQPFFTRRVIVRPADYARLVIARGENPAVADPDCHFPLYRRDVDKGGPLLPARW